MKILLTGVNGFIGNNIARALIAKGHLVKPVSRSHGIDFCQMKNPQDWHPHLEGIEAVINCVGIIGETSSQRFNTLHTVTPSALFIACSQLGIRRVVQISALGADDSAFSKYHLSKRAADDCLRRLDLDWFVLRPALIYGKGGQSAKFFMWLAALPRIPVVGDGQQTVQPVHISDVVDTVLKTLTSKQHRQTLDVAGKEAISFAEWLQWMRRAQGLPRGDLLHIPIQLAMAATYFGRHFNPMLEPENLHMLQTGYWADVRPLTQFLGRSPLPIESNLFFSDLNLAQSTS